MPRTGIRWVVCKRGHNNWKLNKRGQRVCHDCEVLREAKSGAYKATKTVAVLCSEIDRQIAEQESTALLIQQKIQTLREEKNTLLEKYSRKLDR